MPRTILTLASWRKHKKLLDIYFRPSLWWALSEASMELMPCPIWCVLLCMYIVCCVPCTVSPALCPMLYPLSCIVLHCKLCVLNCVFLYLSNGLPLYSILMYQSVSRVLYCISCTALFIMYGTVQYVSHVLHCMYLMFCTVSHHVGTVLCIM